MNMHPLITLTTDFGRIDEYVAVMKGVILNICPMAQIVDISHAIPPQDIRSGAFIFGRAYRFFPKSTVHIIVVDPGVGSGRRILAVQSGEQTFIAPDNGLLSPLFHEGKVSALYEIQNRELFCNTVSATFHGRDIMAPVGARIASGLNISEVGAQINLKTCIIFDPPALIFTNEKIVGEVIHIDHFGNICTSITDKDLALFSTDGTLKISLADIDIDGISETYISKEQGRPIALFDSHNHLEIALSGSSAAERLRIARGDKVTVTFTKCTDLNKKNRPHLS